MRLSSIKIFTAFAISLVILTLGYAIYENKVFGATVLMVPNGGTGASTLSGCLQGNGTGAITGSGSPCGSGGGSFPFDVNANYVSTTTTLGFLNGLFSTASSTINNSLYLPSLSQGFNYIGTNGKINTIASSSINLSWFNNDAGFVTSSGGSDPFTHPAVNTSATTSELWTNGFLSTASSTFMGTTTIQGNLGIGTSSPIDTLHVVGNLKFGYGRDNTYHSGYRPQITDNPLTSGATTINVNSTYQMPASGTIQIENELITYNGITATSFLNATRGALGTSAASHVLNTSVGNVFMTMEANDTYPLVIASNYDPTVSQTNVRVGINSKIPAATLDVYKQSPAANDVLFQVGSSNQGGQFKIIDSVAPVFGIGLKVDSLYMGIPPAYDKIYSGQNTNNFLDFSVGANTVLSSVQNVVLKNAAAGYGVTISTTTTAMPFVSYSSTLPQLSLSEGAGKSLWTFRNLSENLYFSTSTVAGNATSTNPAFGIDNNGNVKVGNAVPYYGTGGNTALVCYMSDGSLGHITITSALASGNCVQN